MQKTDATDSGEPERQSTGLVKSLLSVRPHKVNSLLLVPPPVLIFGQIQKKKKRVGVCDDGPDRDRKDGRGSQD